MNKRTELTKDKEKLVGNGKDGKRALWAKDSSGRATEQRKNLENTQVTKECIFMRSIQPAGVRVSGLDSFPEHWPCLPRRAVPLSRAWLPCLLLLSHCSSRGWCVWKNMPCWCDFFFSANHGHEHIPRLVWATARGEAARLEEGGVEFCRGLGVFCTTAHRPTPCQRFLQSREFFICYNAIGIYDNRGFFS